jgi:hypothetical protein
MESIEALYPLLALPKDGAADVNGPSVL